MAQAAGMEAGAVCTWLVITGDSNARGIYGELAGTVALSPPRNASEAPMAFVKRIRSMVSEDRQAAVVQRYGARGRSRLLYAFESGGPSPPLPFPCLSP